MAQVAPRPEARTVTVELKGAYAGWRCTARADFPAGLLADLQSGQVAKIISVLDAIVIDHNYPGDDGDLAASMAQVEYHAVMDTGIGVFDAIGKLPNR